MISIIMLVLFLTTIVMLWNSRKVYKLHSQIENEETKNAYLKKAERLYMVSILLVLILISLGILQYLKRI